MHTRTMRMLIELATSIVNFVEAIIELCFALLTGVVGAFVAFLKPPQASTGSKNNIASPIRIPSSVKMNVYESVEWLNHYAKVCRMSGKYRNCSYRYALYSMYIRSRTATPLICDITCFHASYAMILFCSQSAWPFARPHLFKVLAEALADKTNGGKDIPYLSSLELRELLIGPPELLGVCVADGNDTTGFSLDLRFRCVVYMNSTSCADRYNN